MAIACVITSPATFPEKSLSTSESKNVVTLNVSDAAQSEEKDEIIIEASCVNKTDMTSLSYRNTSLSMRQRTANQAILGALRLLYDLR